MKTDRELLELAAKAAGMPQTYNEVWKGFYVLIEDKFKGEYWDRESRWNPLTDDGAALRLATRLRMSVSTGPCIAAANTIEGALRGAFFKESTVGVSHDAAVRRVIVQAAAEIGKHIP